MSFFLFQVEESDDTETKKERDSNIEEARERIHTLLDDAFSFLQPHRKTNKESPRPKVVEEAMSERNEAPVYQAPTLPSRYTGISRLFFSNTLQPSLLCFVYVNIYTDLHSFSVTSLLLRCREALSLSHIDSQLVTSHTCCLGNQFIRKLTAIYRGQFKMISCNISILF